MEEEKKFDIEIRPEVATGIYSNLAIITHSSNEFILDFVQMMPGLPKPTVKSRVLMTPDNLQKYESQFGEVKLRDNQTMRPMGFGGEA